MQHITDNVHGTGDIRDSGQGTAYNVQGTAYSRQGTAYNVQEISYSGHGKAYSRQAISYSVPPTNSFHQDVTERNIGHSPWKWPIRPNSDSFGARPAGHRWLAAPLTTMVLAGWPLGTMLVHARLVPSKTRHYSPRPRKCRSLIVCDPSSAHAGLFSYSWINHNKLV